MFLLIGTGIALDVPFVFDEASSGVASYNSNQIVQSHFSSPDLIGVPTVTQVEDNEILAFPVTGGGSAPGETTEINVGELKYVFNARVEPDNSQVHEEALVLASKFPGDLTIDQICSIYRYLKNGEGSIKGWSYARDPRGIDYFMYANQSLRIGERTGCVGAGDCDDFAILMSALIESIGGTTRIILAHNNSTGGHAYTEVYLGQPGTQNNQVEDIIRWLKEKFDADKIYTHIDTDTKDVWLNLDWGPDEKGNTHPGGPFYQGDKHIVLCIRDRYEKTALKLSEPSQDEDKQSIIVPPVIVASDTPIAIQSQGMDIVITQDLVDEMESLNTIIDRENGYNATLKQYEAIIIYPLEWNRDSRRGNSYISEALAYQKFLNIISWLNGKIVSQDGDNPSRTMRRWQTKEMFGVEVYVEIPSLLGGGNFDDAVVLYKDYLLP